MYKTGDTVIYPGTGVCRITDIVKQKFMRCEERTYYVMKAVYDNSDTTIYCPVDNADIKLKKLLDKDEIRELIRTFPTEESLWKENDNERKKYFASIVKEGDRKKLLKLITEVHTKKNEREAEGKKLHVSDEKAMAEAEKILHQELAFSLDMSTEEVAAFIMKELGIIE